MQKLNIIKQDGIKHNASSNVIKQDGIKHNESYNVIKQDKINALILFLNNMVIISEIHVHV